MNYLPDDERPDIVHFKCPLSGLEISLVAGNYPPDSMDTQEEKGGEDSNFWNEQLGNLNFEGGADDKH